MLLDFDFDTPRALQPAVTDTVSSHFFLNATGIWCTGRKLNLNRWHGLHGHQLDPATRRKNHVKQQACILFTQRYLAACTNFIRRVQLFEQEST